MEVAGFAGGTGGFEIREIFENSMLALFLFPTKKSKVAFLFSKYRVCSLGLNDIIAAYAYVDNSPLI